MEKTKLKAAVDSAEARLLFQMNGIHHVSANRIMIAIGDLIDAKLALFAVSSPALQKDDAP